MSTQRTDSAEYICEIAGELFELARKDGLETLAYLLEMTTLEAQAASKQSPDDNRR